jgi:hypothetical protein
MRRVGEKERNEKRRGEREEMRSEGKRESIEKKRGERKK